MTRILLRFITLLLCVVLLPATAGAGEDRDAEDVPAIDALVDRALGADAEERERIVWRLTERGAPAVRRLLARLAGAATTATRPAPPTQPHAALRATLRLPDAASTTYWIEGPRGTSARLFGAARRDGFHALDREEVLTLLRAVKIDPAIRFAESPDIMMDIPLRFSDRAYLARFGMAHPTGELIFLLHRKELRAGPAQTRTAPATAAIPHQGPVLEIEARIVELPEGRLEALLGAYAPTVEKPARVLPEAVVSAVLEAEDLKILSAPRLSALDGQKANVSVLNQTSYVRDYEIKQGTDGRSVADPVVDVIQEGLILDLVGRMGPESTTLEVKLSHAELVRPIPEWPIVTGGLEVTIQIPELLVDKVDVTVEVPDGGTVVVGGLGERERGGRIALLRVRHVTLDLPSKDERGDLTPR